MTPTAPLTRTELDTRLNGILELNAFETAWRDLRATDENQVDAIMIALQKALETSREGLAEATRADDRGALRFWLLREAIDVRAFTSQFLSISETMALRESRLRAFAMESIDVFFDEVFTGVDRFFARKSEAIGGTLAELNTRANMLTDTRATVLKTTNRMIEILRQTAEKHATGLQFGDFEPFDDRGLLEQALDAHLSRDEIERGMREAIDGAAKRFEEGWARVITDAAPDVRQVNAFTSKTASMDMPGLRIELGAAEQTFAAGMAAAVVGSVGLALGWHTLLYALLNVFPPIAIATLAASIAMAFAQRGRQHDKRLEQKDQILNEIKNRFKLAIFNEKQADFNDRTLFEHLLQINAAIITRTLSVWQETICGKLSLEDYRKLIGASTEHLTRIDALIESLTRSGKDD